MKAETTPNGHAIDEAVSALQKSIRRGLEEDALYWGKELYLTDKAVAGIAWSRLRVIASEDRQQCLRLCQLAARMLCEGERLRR